MTAFGSEGMNNSTDTETPETAEPRADDSKNGTNAAPESPPAGNETAKAAES